MKFKLYRIFWTIFLALVLFEAVVIYKYLFLNYQKTIAPGPVVTSQVLNVDENAAAGAGSWFSARQNFRLPGLELRSGNSGRENPFLEYK